METPRTRTQPLRHDGFLSAENCYSRLYGGPFATGHDSRTLESRILPERTNLVVSCTLWPAAHCSVCLCTPVGSQLTTCHWTAVIFCDGSPVVLLASLRNKLMSGIPTVTCLHKSRAHHRYNRYSIPGLIKDSQTHQSPNQLFGPSQQGQPLAWAENAPDENMSGRSAVRLRDGQCNAYQMIRDSADIFSASVAR
jgi:hypothetical protein